QVLWIFCVASPDGRAFTQLLLDVETLQFCVRSSAVKGEEVRFRTPAHLACGGSRAWHHVALTHARPKSRILGNFDKLSLWVDGELADTVKVDSMSFTTGEGPAEAYMGCPHPQAFLNPSVGGTVSPLWHLGPCALLTEVVDLAPVMFAAGPEYTGMWAGEEPMEASSSANASGTLRRLQTLGGDAGFSALGGDVPHALARRGLRDLDKCFNVTDRIFYWRPADQAHMTDTFYLLLSPEQITFAFQPRHMERPGGSGTYPGAVSTTASTTAAVTAAATAATAATAAAAAATPTRQRSSSVGESRSTSPSCRSSSSIAAVAAAAASAASASVAAFSAASAAAEAATPQLTTRVSASARRSAAAGSQLVTGWLFNTARETSPAPRAPAPVGCVYGEGVGCSPSGLPRAISGSGGPAILFPLVRRAQTEKGLCAVLRLIAAVVRGGGVPSAGYMQSGGGYLVLAGLLREKRGLLGPQVARECFAMSIDEAPE
ncbi:unnamed protein product, partial [Choristocarpus tenellus]